MEQSSSSAKMEIDGEHNNLTRYLYILLHKSENIWLDFLKKKEIFWSYKWSLIGHINHEMSITHIWK